MNKELLLKIKDKTKWFMESPWFMVSIGIITLVNYFCKFGGLSVLVLLVLLLIMFIVGAKFNCIPNLFIMAIAGGLIINNGYTFAINPSKIEWIFYIIACFSVFIFGIIKYMPSWQDFKKKVKDDWVLWSMLLLLIPMLLSFLYTPVLADTAMLTVVYLVVPAIYFVFILFMDKKDVARKNMYISSMIVSVTLALQGLIVFLLYYPNSGMTIDHYIYSKSLNIEWANINTYCCICLFFMIPSVFYFIEYSNVKNRLFALFVFLFSLLIQLLCVFRSGLLGLFVSLIFAFIVYLRQIKDFKKELKYLIPIFTILVVALIGIVIGFEELTRKGIISFGDGGRTPIYSLASRNFINNPFIGTGFGSSRYFINKELNEYMLYYHNWLLEVASTMGIIGLLFFGFYLVMCFMNTRSNDVYSKLVVSLMLFMLVTGFFDNTFFNCWIMPLFMIFYAPLEKKSLNIKRV